MRLQITEKGKEAFKGIKDFAQYDKYDISQDEWLYLGYLTKESPDITNIQSDYGTVGKRIFNKFIDKGYAKRV